MSTGRRARMRIALVTCDLFPRLTDDDRLLADALRARGHDVVVWDWQQPRPGGPIAVTVVRSPWNFPEHPAAFGAWLERAAASGPVRNPVEAIAWNIHKRYLLDLKRAGVPVVPTEVIERGTRAELAGVQRARGWHDVVIKPAVGGSSRQTVRLSHVGQGHAAAHLRELSAAEDVVIQPFVPAVLTQGELSLVYFAGVFSHAVRKRATAGDWRVQSDFGGTAEPAEPPPHARRAADLAVAAGPASLFCRVDLLTGDEHDAQVIEHELVDCELFLGSSPGAADRFAEAILDDPEIQP